MDYAQAFNIVVPYYNLALVAIVVSLFIRMLRTKPTSPDVYLRPWYFMFAAIVVFIIEEVTTVLRHAGLITLDVYINGYFELTIVSLIIYTLLTQLEYIQKHKST